MNIPKTLFLERLWNKIQQCSHDESCPYCCWLWQGAKNKKGYGNIRIQHNEYAVTITATRVVYETWNAICLPSYLCVCHHCDTPSCCNPSHLWIGTQKENLADCRQKGRMATGSKNGNFTHPQSFPRGQEHYAALFTDDTIRAMRNRYRQGNISLRALAREQRMSESTLRAIITYKTWKHIS